MSVKVKVICPSCSQEIDYDGKIFMCPNCLIEFEKEDIAKWRKQLSAQPQLPTVQLKAVTDTKTEGQDGKPKIPTGRIMPQGVKIPDVKSGVPVSQKPSVGVQASEKKPAQNGVVCEVCGRRYYYGKEKEAFLYILQNGLIDEIVDKNNKVTDKAKRLLASMGMSEPFTNGYSRIRKFFEIIYGTVFPDMPLPFYIFDERTGVAVANSRAQFIDRLENNAYADVIFRLNEERMTLKELVESGVAGAYLRVGDGIAGLRRLFESNNKRISIDENCTCVGLGGDTDICRIDDKLFKRYEYYLEKGAKPCDGYEEIVSYDAEFLRLYGGYDHGNDVNRFMREYFFLLSVAFERRGECEVFGATYNLKSFLAALETSAEAAAEGNGQDKFILMRQLLKHKVFGDYTSEYETIIAKAPTAESALFEAYYSLPKDKKRLYYEGKYLSAYSIAQRIGERGSVGNLLNDDSRYSFLASVKRCITVDIPQIKSQIDSGINSILGGLK